MKKFVSFIGALVSALWIPALGMFVFVYILDHPAVTERLTLVALAFALTTVMLASLLWTASVMFSEAWKRARRKS